MQKENHIIALVLPDTALEGEAREYGEEVSPSSPHYIESCYW